MKYVLKVYNILEFGQRVDANGNPHQEDCIFPAYGQQKESDRLFILCDGMGGHEAGEVASSTVCSAMSNSVFESSPDAEGDFSDDNLKKAVADAFNALDGLTDANVSNERKMGTTMTFLKFHSKGCTIAHMGDSRVYHIRPGKDLEDTRILFVTNDHSLVNDLIKIGELTPEEAKLSKQKNIITRAMQPNMDRRPKPDIYHTADIQKGDFFYMCSDGMLENMSDDNIRYIFSEATGDNENTVDILTQATSQNRDNHSAIIVHVMDVIDPLPTETKSSASNNNKSQPIMGTVEDNTHVKPQKQGHSRRNLYIFSALILVLLVVGSYFLGSRFSKKQKTKPIRIENSRKGKDKTVNRKESGIPSKATGTSEVNKPKSRDSSHNSNSIPAVQPTGQQGGSSTHHETSNTESEENGDQNTTTVTIGGEVGSLFNGQEGTVSSDKQKLEDGLGGQ